MPEQPKMFDKSLIPTPIPINLLTGFTVIEPEHLSVTSSLAEYLQQAMKPHHIEIQSQIEESLFGIPHFVGVDLGMPIKKKEKCICDNGYYIEYFTTSKHKRIKIKQMCLLCKGTGYVVVK